MYFSSYSNIRKYLAQTSRKNVNKKTNLKRLTNEKNTFQNVICEKRFVSTFSA